MKILHLASSHRWTGVAEPAVTLAREQTAAGHEVTLACQPGGSLGGQARYHGVALEGRARITLGRSPVDLVRDIAALRRLFLAEGIDVVHCHLPHDHWVAAAACASIRLAAAAFPRQSPGPALVRTFHSRRLREDAGHRRLNADLTDAVICTNHEARRRILAAFGLEPDRVSVVAGSVDCTRFHPGLNAAAQRRHWNIPPGAVAVGLIARMRPGRGHLALIDTMETVARKQPNIIYIISGRGELKREVLRRIKEHPLADKFRYVGYRSHDLPELHAALDVAVLVAPGTDATCRSMLESMACGRPVIGVRTGAMADTIRHGENGWLIEPCEGADLVAALGDAIIHAAGNRKGRLAAGLSARRLMEEEYDSARRAREVMDCYSAALERRSRRI